MRPPLILASLILAALPCLGAAQPVSTDSEFQKDLAAKRAAMRTQQEKAKAAVEKKAAQRKEAAGDYAELAKADRLKEHANERFTVSTLGRSTEAMTSTVAFLYKREKTGDELAFVTVRNEKGLLAVWNSAGLLRAGLFPPVLKDDLLNCNQLDQSRLLKLLDKITEIVVEKDLVNAQFAAIGLSCEAMRDSMKDEGERKGDRGTKRVDDGERKGDINRTDEGERKGDRK